MKKITLSIFFFLICVGIQAQCPVTVSGVYPCEPTCNGYFTAFGSGGFPYTYNWVPSGQTTQTIFGLCGGTTYTVYVVNSLGCLDSAIVTIPVGIQLTFLPPTVVNASCSSCCDGSITTNVTGGTAPYDYAWSPGGQSTATITGLCIGDYIVCATDQNFCTTCDTISVSFSIGMQEAGKEDIFISPNPATSVISLSGIKGPAQITLYNVVGKIVLTKQITKNKTASSTLDLSKMEIDLSKETNGIYFIKIVTENNSITKKIIKN